MIPAKRGGGAVVGWGPSLAVMPFLKGPFHYGGPAKSASNPFAACVMAALGHYSLVLAVTVPLCKVPAYVISRRRTRHRPGAKAMYVVQEGRPKQQQIMEMLFLASAL